MKNLYESEIKKELAKYANTTIDILTENDITLLPKPVKRFFSHCGYIGKPKMNNAEVIWKDVYFKMSPHKNWMSLTCYQFNSVPEPNRIAYMKGKLMGLLPLEGRDKYQDGQGNMLFKFLKFIPVANAKSKELDQSALVTVLAECFLVPTYALQDYISWTSMDTNTAKAVIKYNNQEASGLFYFNDRGEFTRFETDDRYYSEKGTEYKKMKWSAIAENYIEKDGIRFPSSLKSIWHTEQGDYEYFKGKIVAIRYNIT
ncbi:hypothetical protein JCM14036_31510 [Desulfotomaculum defluvii]